MKPFEYFEPRTVGEATKLLFKYGKKARVLAGGIDLIPKMRRGDLRAEYIVNIQRIPRLEYIKVEGKEGLRFGAMTKLYAMESSGAVQRSYPILYEAIHQITSVQAKQMGTVVGNLCVGTPASDVATVLMALGAEVRIGGVKGQRRELVEKFYLGHHRTSLQRGEMVTEVFLPSPASGMRSAFLNLVRTHADIAKVTVAVAVIVRRGICQEARVVMGAVAPTVLRAARAEGVLKGQRVTVPIISEVAEAAAGEARPITDLRSTAEYRREMAKVLVRRALEEVVERATG